MHKECVSVCMACYNGEKYIEKQIESILPQLNENDELHITIAGVNKKLGAEELQERGGLEVMEDGFVFRKGGGTESKYNDKDLGLVKINFTL